MNIFKFEFKRLLKGSIIWSLVCGCIVVMFMLFFPSMKDSGIQDIVSTKLDAIPETFLEAFNISQEMDFTDISDFSAYIFQYVVMAGVVYSTILGVSSLVREESEGTIEFLYSKPITRSKIVTSKILANVLIFYMFLVIVGIITMGVGIVVKPEEVKAISLLMDIKVLCMGMAFVGYIFMAIGFLISVFIKSSKQSIPIALGIFFASYIIGIFSRLQDRLNNFIYLSPFDYAIPAEIIKNGFETKFIIIGLCLIIVSLIITYNVYNKKDFN